MYAVVRQLQEKGKDVGKDIESCACLLKEVLFLKYGLEHYFLNQTRYYPKASWPAKRIIVSMENSKDHWMSHMDKTLNIPNGVLHETITKVLTLIHGLPKKDKNTLHSLLIK